MKHAGWMRLVAGFLLVAAQGAHAQFTSAWGTIYLPANFNGYDTLSTQMRLVSNGVWQSYQRLTNYNNAKFLFATTFFTNTWKETDQSQFGIPMSGVAEYNSGNDIQINGATSAVLKFTFNDSTRAYSVKNATAGTAPTEIWINELHYDNSTVADTNEGVEVAGPAGTSLTGYSIYFYNGGNGAVYQTTNLVGALTNNPVNGLATKWFAVTGLQNDAEAVALVKVVSTVTSVVQFLAYEGIFLATNGPAAGTFPLLLGVSEDPVPAAGYSLQLTGSGSQYSDFLWSGPLPHSRDAMNTNQLALAGPVPASIVVSDANASPPIALTNQTMAFTMTVAGSTGPATSRPWFSTVPARRGISRR